MKILFPSIAIIQLLSNVVVTINTAFILYYDPLNECFIIIWIVEGVYRQTSTRLQFAISSVEVKDLFGRGSSSLDWRPILNRRNHQNNFFLHNFFCNKRRKDRTYKTNRNIFFLNIAVRFFFNPSENRLFLKRLYNKLCFIYN